MPSLLLDDDQRLAADRPSLGGGLLGLGAPRIEAASVTPADAADVTAQQVGDFVDQQRAISAQRGLWDDASGLPTQKGLLDAAQQYGQGLLFGTTAPKPGFTAFHGSPYDFNAFDSSKIGTGEGAQAYGHGLYLAENEGIAKGYRDQLGRTKGPLADDLNAAYQDFQGNLQQLWDLKRKGAPVPQELADRIEASQTKYSELHANAGRMYEVGVNADPAHFLDWDKPLSEQHPKVQEALQHPTFGDPDMSQTGAQFLHNEHQAGDPHEVAAALQRAGIPGIRYLDAGSRSAGTGSSNYVIFDPSTMEILRKYGLAGLMAGAGGAAASRGNGS